MCSSASLVGIEHRTQIADFLSRLIETAGKRVAQLAGALGKTVQHLEEERPRNEQHGRRLAVEPRPGAQDAKTYRVTDEGITVFMDWLTAPYSPTTIYTRDRGFRRFDGIRVLDPFS